ncbi:MAG TPA: L-threonylcarbamoyladenylate synthase [Bacteroidales bacterium]|nr:L-threonylcarbamoyladenylate synthase [Bacteroidales bacterium]
MIIRIHPLTPSERLIIKTAELLKNGGTAVFPTDTVYGLGCDITKPKAIEKVAQIKGVRMEKANFSFIFHDLSQLSDYTRPVSNSVFKLMKHCLPGPFTFILEANTNIPKLFRSKKKTIGIRIPDNNIIREIVRRLGNPVLTTSIHDEDEILDYTTDPELIHEHYMNQVDVVIDGGYGHNQPSTVIDCSGDEPLLIRQGLGILE